MLGISGTLCFVLLYVYVFLVTKDQNRPISEIEIGEKHGVSVVICAHNEAKNLRQHLQKILEQDYHHEQIPRFEVVVVNDRSEDDSIRLLEEFQQIWPQLTVVTISADEPRTFPGKKYALAKGIQAAKNDWLLCTDADCTPASSKWLQMMVAPLQNGKEIVAGLGAFKTENSWLNTFVRYETLHTFHSLHAFAAAGLPYMAVGRNMAFHRSVFVKAQQHPAWTKIPSGDDDLLVSFCATKDNFAVVQHPDSFTWTEAEKTLGSYLHQKQRHVSTGK
ncbi:MAG: glycosyltransferase, partial [Bacteroidetes bacterium]|nr:glycosyltransferase [Bacteroidota bacterium]